MGHKELSERTLHALISLRQNGVKLCMATGRGYLSAPRFPGIDFDALLTFNGSYVTVGDEIIFKCPLDRMDKLQILQNLKGMHRAVAISNEHFIITNGTDPDLEQYFRFGNEMLKIDKRFDERVREDIYQMMCACREEEYERILYGTHHTQITAWWDRAADIIPLECGKGNAVRAVLQHFGFTKEEAIAFGDGVNDIEMLEAVGTGVAMGNAKDEIKAHATCTCRSVEEDGVYDFA